MKHNQEADLKLLNDPIQDYEIMLTPKLLQFANVSSVVDMYLSKQVDVNMDDLGIKQKLTGQKRSTIPQSSRLTQHAATAKSKQMRTKSGRQSPLSTSNLTARSRYEQDSKQQLSRT